MQALDLPACIHEFAGEPIQQLGVGGRFGPRAEILRRRHQALAKVLEP